MTLKPLACGFHSHAEYSLDSGSTSAAKLKHAVSVDRSADCLTDHGILSGLYSQWTAAESMKKKGTLPKDFIIIQGVEAYMIDEDRPWKPSRKGSKVLEPHYYHLTIHFKTMQAYLYFCNLSREAEERSVVKFGERKPLLKFADLEPIADQITMGSGCLIGPIQKNVLVGRMDIADRMYQYLRNLVGPDNFYVEIFPHIIEYNWRAPVYDSKTKRLITAGEFEKITTPNNWEGTEPPPEPDPCTGCLDIQKVPNQVLLAMAERYGDRALISLDDHYGSIKDKAVQESRLGNGKEKWKFHSDQQAKTSEEAAERLRKQLGISDKKLEEMIDNSYHFIEKFKDYRFPTVKDQVLLPTVEMVYDDTYKSKSTVEIYWDLVKKHDVMPKEDHPDYQVYKDRVDFELSVLANNDAGIDFLPYIFLLEDVCAYAKLNDILFTSRGSAGGSLALFLINIVITDPIKHKLSFERFLNPGRIAGGSWPDVDLDWENRHLILAYLKEKYGECYALIASDSKMKLKSSMLDCTRAINGHVDEATTRLSSSIKIPLGTYNEAEWLYGTDTVPGFIDDPKDQVAVGLKAFSLDNPEIWEMINRCMGITRQRGVHAGGVVITPGPVQSFMPVILTSKGEDYATAYDMHGVEYTGGVKYDMLGIKTLDATGISLRSIKKELGITIPWKEFEEDPEVAEHIIGGMQLEGIFQLNTNVAKPFVKRIKPMNVTEMAALTALCRPGALDADAPDPDFKGSAAEYYVACAQGRREPYFIHEDLREILEETHGVIVYQEQAMKIGAKCAGYSEANADIIIRKGIGKKIKEKIEEFSRHLEERLPARGWNQGQIDHLVRMIMASANYSFNASHSVSYAIVAWNGAWIKHHYPAHYWKGVLTVFGEDEDKLMGMMEECEDRVRPIDAVKSHATEWTIEDEFYLRMPLNIVKGCGEKGVVGLKDFLDLDMDTLNERSILKKAEKKAKKDKKEGAHAVV